MVLAFARGPRERRDVPRDGEGHGWETSLRGVGESVADMNEAWNNNRGGRRTRGPSDRGEERSSSSGKAAENRVRLQSAPSHCRGAKHKQSRAKSASPSAVQATKGSMRCFGSEEEWPRDVRTEQSRCGRKAASLAVPSSGFKRGPGPPRGRGIHGFQAA